MHIDILKKYFLSSCIFLVVLNVDLKRQLLNYYYCSQT